MTCTPDKEFFTVHSGKLRESGQVQGSLRGSSIDKHVEVVIPLASLSCTVTLSVVQFHPVQNDTRRVKSFHFVHDRNIRNGGREKPRRPVCVRNVSLLAFPIGQRTASIVHPDMDRTNAIVPAYGRKGGLEKSNPCLSRRPEHEGWSPWIRMSWVGRPHPSLHSFPRQGAGRRGFRSPSIIREMDPLLAPELGGVSHRLDLEAREKSRLYERG